MPNFLTLPPKLTKIILVLTSRLVTSLGLLLVLVVLASTGFAASNTQAATPDGAIDPTFKSGSGPNAPVRFIIQQSDSKILIAGIFTTYNDKSVKQLGRLNPDGSVDPTFTSGLGSNYIVSAIALQNDGKIIVAGLRRDYSDPNLDQVIRLNNDGTVDSSFEMGIGANSGVYSIAIQNDGKILIGGTFTTYKSLPIKYLARLNSDGTLDTSFNTGSGFNGSINTLALQSDGKIIIGGDFTAYNGVAHNRLLRLNSDATVDTSFNHTLTSDERVHIALLQSDGRILLKGAFITATPFSLIIRLNSDGSRDTSFNNAINQNNYIYTIALQNDGKLLVGGNLTINNASVNLARFNSDGSPDVSFDVGTGATSHVYALALQNDNKILIGGLFTGYNGIGRNRLARLNPNGTLDNFFLNSPTGIEYTGYSAVRVLATKLQNDGKIVIGGQFSIYNGVSRSKIARLNNDGTLDTSFNPGLGANGDVLSVALENSGKIIIGGQFTTYEGITRTSIARLNPDGSLDNSFNPGLGANGAVNTIILQPDGKILIAGSFTSYNGTSKNKLARLNPDGSLDMSFTANINPDITVSTMVLQDDGKVIVGAYFNRIEPYLVRLNLDGALDNTFNSNLQFHYYINVLKIQNDGKIVVGGKVINYVGASSVYITRLNADGSPDTSFNVGKGTNDSINDITFQSDGSIIIVGDFSSYNGAASSRVARLNANGSLDTFFNVDSIYSPLYPAGVNSVAIQNDSKIIIGGNFGSVGSYTRDSLARLEATNKTSSQVTVTSTSNPASFGTSLTFTATVTPANASGTITFNFDNANNTTSVTTTLVNGLATYITNTLPVGTTSVWVTYSGDAAFLLSESQPYIQNINKSATDVNLTSNPNPTVFGQLVTFTTKVNVPGTGEGVPMASGVVTFSFNPMNGNSLATKPVAVINGLATYVTGTLATGSYTVTANYSGDANYNPGSSQNYNQIIECNPLLVTNPTDNGQATDCGTLSYALTHASSGVTVIFSLSTGRTVSFSDLLTATVPVGVTLNGGVNGIVLDGKGINGDGLRLAGNNMLFNLTIRGFSGHEVVILPDAQTSKFYRVKIEN